MFFVPALGNAHSELDGGLQNSFQRRAPISSFLSFTRSFIAHSRLVGLETLTLWTPTVFFWHFFVENIS